jgi:hypothetical protein
MSERSRLLGEQVEMRRRRQRMEVTCDALREQLRALLSPVEDSANLEADDILDAAVVLHGHLEKLRIMNAKLGVLDRELGQ